MKNLSKKIIERAIPADIEALNKNIAIIKYKLSNDRKLSIEQKNLYKDFINNFEKIALDLKIKMFEYL